MRFGGRPLRPGPAVLVRAPTTRPGRAYVAAAALSDLAATGAPTAVTPARLLAPLEAILMLDGAECRRLHAHLTWLAAGGAPGPLGRGWPAARREALADVLVAAVVRASDGRPGPADVDALTHMFGRLGVDRSRLYSRLHGLGLGAGRSGEGWPLGS